MIFSRLLTFFLLRLCRVNSSVLQDEGIPGTLQHNMQVTSSTARPFFLNLKHLESIEDAEYLLKSQNESIDVQKSLIFPSKLLDLGDEALDPVLPAPCLNNATFAFNDEVHKTCKWIRINENRRQRLCKNSDVRRNCPQSCGLCCEDDPEYFFITKNSTRRSCAWIANKEVQQRFCDKRKNGKMVRDACPLTCNFCRSYVPLPSISSNDEPISSSVEGINTVSSAPSQVICQDNPLYNAPFQGDCGCNLFVGTNCSLWSVFLSDSQLSEVFENCPVSCGICSMAMSSEPQECIDNQLYSSPANPTFGCEIYEGTDCSIWSPLLSPVQMDEMYLNCPVACGIECSSTPSLTPSQYPSLGPTVSPSIVPSKWPTNRPTVSDSPTFSPTLRPSQSANPTHEASMRPTISILPSAQPVKFASLSPTVRASDHPSTSMYPSSKIVLPSASPVAVPSNESLMPSKRPCDPPEGYPFSSMAPSQAPSTFIELPTFIPSTNPSSVPSERICSDDITYRSPINSIFGCNLYCGTECSKWSVLLTTSQMQEIFTRCPDTCKVPCDYIWPDPSPSYGFSLSPSIPSHRLSSSKVPSISPSALSTKSPGTIITTNVPSATPSALSEVGSSSPSLHPQRTHDPSNYPSTYIDETVSPSSVISNIPSHQKSQHPSSSSNPSRSPICGVSYDERHDDIYTLISTISESSHLHDITTPQGKAFHWIVHEDIDALCPNIVYSCPNALIQRYILAVIYFSTNGNEWFQCSASSTAQDACGMEYPFVSKQKFLSSGSECNWAGIDCNDSQCVTRIEFEDNNLNGIIPNEIGSLVHLEFWGMERGGLTSTIPSTISSLTQLYFLDLDFNQLTGRIPTEVYSLTNLRQLDLNSNKLKGQINGMERLTKLQFIQFHENFLTGEIPSGLGDLMDLQVLTTYRNNFNNTIPDRICDHRDYNGGHLSTLIADCPCACCTATFCP